jgi:hypothetical protein
MKNLIALLLLVVLGAPASAEVRKSSAILAGQPTSGISVALQGPPNPVHIGNQIPLTVELRNSSQSDVHLLLGTRLNYLFQVVDEASGSAVELRPSPKPALEAIGGPSHGRALSPGFSHFIDLDLSDFIDILKAGKYRVTVTSRIFYVDPQTRSGHDLKLRPSSPIEIVVLP